MNAFNIILFIAVIVLIIMYIKKPNKKNTVSDEKENYPQIKTNEPLPYKKNDFIFTKNEYACYKTLKPLADKYGLEIFSKVRLADIVSVNSNTTDKQRWFNRIKSKHIDFVLLDNQYLQPKLLIELDDSSHDTTKRIERDKFVDEVCKVCNIKIKHIRSYNAEELDEVLKSSL